jgi:aspartyl-tRNA(Asn)/glutamyl-tRNA(Gln) amidotransferase subunit B
MLHYIEAYGLSEYDAAQLVDEKILSDIFNLIAEKTNHKKQLANFLLGPVRSWNNAAGLSWDSLQITPENWDKLLSLVADGKISFSVAAQRILPVMLENIDADPLFIAKENDLIQDAGQDEIKDWVESVVNAMPEKVMEYRKGKKGLIGLFVGEVKKISKGKADPKIATELLNQFLNNK